MVLEEVVDAHALHVLPADGRDVRRGPTAVVVDVQVALVDQQRAVT